VEIPAARRASASRGLGMMCVLGVWRSFFAEKPPSAPSRPAGLLLVATSDSEERVMSTRNRSVAQDREGPIVLTLVSLRSCVVTLPRLR